MPVTQDFKDTIQACALGHAAFRQSLLNEAVDSLLSGDREDRAAQLHQRHGGFCKLARVTKKSSKSLMRMLGPNGNPRPAASWRSLLIFRKKKGYGSAYAHRPRPR